MLLKGKIPREEGFLRGQRCNRKGGLEVLGLLLVFWKLSKYAKTNSHRGGNYRSIYIAKIFLNSVLLCYPRGRFPGKRVS